MVLGKPKVKPATDKEIEAKLGETFGPEKKDIPLDKERLQKLVNEALREAKDIEDEI